VVVTEIVAARGRACTRWALSTIIASVIVSKTMVMIDFWLIIWRTLLRFPLVLKLAFGNHFVSESLFVLTPVLWLQFDIRISYKYFTQVVLPTPVIRFFR
jgi:hypothetical protein